MTPNYTAPVREYHFCLYELLGMDEHVRLPGFGEVTPDVVGMVIEEAAKFAETVIQPLNRSGDEEGCVLENGVVQTPRGFREAYRLLCEGGWPSLTCDPAYGGQGLPHMVNVVFEEMLNAANLSFGLYPGLTRGAYVALSRYGSDSQKSLYLPRLASGEWAGSMCLTEAHAGTDLGLLRTSAKPIADGSYAVTGTKIFISAGEHDLTPNIIYLVLARLPGAPPGTRGISLFVVPKFLVDGEGRLGQRNEVSCGAIEQKMGIKASATCVMNFDGATGWLVGEPHQGLKAMFAMMNTERIAVGIQGLAVAEASYQNAVVYARERLQGRASKVQCQPSQPADPIIVHPDIRRILLTQRALTQGCRALALWTAQAFDVSERHPDDTARREADGFVALMTPVVKALLTDCGSEVANLGMQVLGGHGYMRPNLQEQLVRDVRVTQIYEGTNSIQALDLLGRKVLANGGLLQTFMAPVEAFLAGQASDPRMAEFVTPVADVLDRLKRVTAAVAARAAADPDETGAAATDYLRLFGLTALGYLWARMAAVALGREEDGFYRSKVTTARFFMQRILPQSLALETVIASGAGNLMSMAEADF